MVIVNCELNYTAADGAEVVTVLILLCSASVTLSSSLSAHLLSAGASLSSFTLILFSYHCFPVCFGPSAHFGPVSLGVHASQFSWILQVILLFLFLPSNFSFVCFYLPLTFFSLLYFFLESLNPKVHSLIPSFSS